MIPMKYAVWLPALGEEWGDAEIYEADNAKYAAQQAAANDYAIQDTREWDWPVTYHVQAGPNAPIYSVEVNIELEPHVLGK